MLQELTFGRLENEFYNIKPTDSNLVVCVNKNCILVKKNEDGSIDFPTVAEAKCWAENSKWESWREEYFQYLFRMQEENYFLWMGNAGDCTDALINMRKSDRLVSWKRKMRAFQPVQRCICLTGIEPVNIVAVVRHRLFMIQRNV